MAGAQATPRTQAERSASTRKQLIEAAIACVMEQGYARTTAVQVSARAGLTRGAYHHHYSSLGELYADVLEALYRRFEELAVDGGEASLEGIFRRGLAYLTRPEFRVVLELWLACRNDPALAATLGAAIERMSLLFEPSANPRLAQKLGDDPRAVPLYRLAFEASIGLALGRATSPDGAPVAHEEQVVGLLLSMAREWDERSATP